MIQKNKPRVSNSLGFTLVELLIATSIFTVILLVVTFGIVNIGKIYYKGINSAKTQSVARAISDEIGQAIQFSGSTIIPTSSLVTNGKFCIGDTKYSYFLSDFTSAAVSRTLISEVDPLCSQPTSLPSIDSTGTVAAGVVARDLVSAPMRLANIEVVQIPSTSSYKVRVRVISGDNDLIERPGGDPKKAFCRTTTGSQFCAMSELYTIVNKRI